MPWSYSHVSSSFLERPEPVARVAELMSTFGPRWALCGGWAVDSWLGRRTRDHGDIDVTVFHDDQRAIFDHLAGWHLIAHDPNVAGATTEPWNGRQLDLPAHIHARPGEGLNIGLLNKLVLTPGAEPLDDSNFEVMVNERSGEDWVLNHDPFAALPFKQSIRESLWGLPTAAPEVLLFFKATAYTDLEGWKPRKRDEQDFVALLPQLSGAQRRWLREATSLIANHPWVAQFSL